MADTRNEILDRACELYLEEGLDGFSMRELARRVGVTAPALYRHFDSREGVLLEVVNEAYRTLTRYLHRALEGATPRERFRMAGDAYMEFALDQPRMYQVLYAVPDMLGVQQLPEETAAHACAIGQFWNDRVRESMDAGLLRGDLEAEDVSTTLWAHAHGILSLFFRGMLASDPDELRRIYRESNRRILGGLGAPGVDWSAGPEAAAGLAETGTGGAA